MRSLLVVLALLALTFAATEYTFARLQAADARHRARHRALRIARDRAAIRNPAAFPPGIDMTDAVTHAAEWGMTVTEAATTLLLWRTRMTIAATLDPGPFDAHRPRTRR